MRPTVDTPKRLLALLAAITAVSCAQPERWNLVLVTLDTTRADHIGCYGNEAIRTPAIDRLAAEGARFANAFAAVPITAPSHTTIMTGKYPLAHGVRDNGLFVLDEEERTLAEILRDEGYATGAAIGAFPLSSRFGLDQGFDLYDDHVTIRYEDYAGDRELPKLRLFFDERPAGWVNEAILPWLEEHAADPFFLWVHYFDPHQPQEPPPPYDQLYATNLYDGEIAYADESLGVLIARLEQLGVYDRTVVVVTADHGEGLGEHEELTHSMLLYNGTLHVPLVVRMPSGAAGAVIEQPVGTVDILPTVLDLLGVEAPGDAQGRTLAPLVRGASAAESSASAPEPLYAETLSPRFAHRWGELRALIADGYKYVFGPRPELFDLAADPRELDDLVAREPERAELMQRQLARFIDRHAADEPKAIVDMDAQTRQRLLALGYLHGSVASGERVREELRRDGSPPQDRVGDTGDWSQARDFLHRGKPLEAKEILLDLVARNPENPTYRELLANAYLRLGQADESMALLEEIRRRYGESESDERLLLQLAGVHMRLGDLESALELVRRSQRGAESAEGQHYLATILDRMGRRTEQISALRRALELDPVHAEARLDLAVLLAREGEVEEADSHFRRALADQPYSARTHYNYGTFLLDRLEVERARSRFLRAVALDDAYLRAHYALLVLDLEAGRREAAAERFDRLARQAPESPLTAQAQQLLGEAP